MEMFKEFIFVLSLIGIVSASTRPVTIRDKKINQLVTSSLLTWETFRESDAKLQFQHAIVGGEFTRAEVMRHSYLECTLNEFIHSISSPLNLDFHLHFFFISTEISRIYLSINNQFCASFGVCEEES
jgi:hypothetical protein